ncbi:PmoA family protein [Sunxiuqinia sp. A32]|uniref:DUF6807 domain-containing protein n=1 Tax=Sunxiuqinia sp. A32 TaxID=3461496 RepID=UPI004045F655
MEDIVKLCYIILLVLAYGVSNGQTINYIEKPEESKIDVMIDNNLFTSYLYAPSIIKPILWPVISEQGNHLTRSFPWDSKSGERVDHPTHTGTWLNYGNVNGVDFWNNSNSIPSQYREQLGRIKHREIKNIYSEKSSAKLIVNSQWISENGIPMLDEETTYTFKVDDNYRIIDRTTKLTNLLDTVVFNDDNDGLFAIRVCRELELPEQGIQELTNINGGIIKMKVGKNQPANGNYLSSEGISGTDVWGTRARWMKLFGKVNNEKITLAIIDHPDNLGYPTYWNARPYGLFAANPFGQRIFNEGKNELNFSMLKGESITFNYRFVVISGEYASNDEIDKLTLDFEKQTLN